MHPTDYLQKNRDSWNQRTAYHVNSAFYDQQNFIRGNSSLKDIELSLLGDITSKKILHLQCHFGQDTISLARMGAEATGVDFSDQAIEQAELLSIQTNTNTHFVCCDIYDLKNHLDEKFDLVYTSYGTIGWLPDIERWASIVSHFLKPGGEFIFIEFHPVVWMFDNNFQHIQYNYFNASPIIETETGTYADINAPIKTENVGWNHPISDVVNSIISNGLIITLLNEYDYSPFDCFRETIEFEKGKFRIKHLENKIPMVYAITARKPIAV